MSTRPVVFMASSTEGLPVLEALYPHIDACCEVLAWNTAFSASEYTVESLESRFQHIDFAVVILSNDDTLVSRGQKFAAPRDNLILELGIFVGAIGRKRTFVIEEREAKVKLPSDLLGLTTLRYSIPEKGELMNAMQAVGIEIKRLSRGIGARNVPVE